MVYFTGEMFQDQNVADSYDAHVRNNFRPGGYQGSIDEILSLTPITPEDTVIDLACGTGISTERILQRSPRQVIGVDFSEAMLKYARERCPQVQFIHAPAEDFARLVPKANKVVSINLFRYLKQPQRVLEEIYQVLLPGGEYVFNVALRSPTEQFLATRFLALTKETVRETTPRIEVADQGIDYEPPHTRAALDAILEESELSVRVYQEKLLYALPEMARQAFQEFMDGFVPVFRQALGEDPVVEQIIVALQEKLAAAAKENIPTGREAYLCLKKGGTL